MSRRRHTPEQVVRKLREADRLLGESMEPPEVFKQLNVSEQTYYRWRNQFGAISEIWAFSLLRGAVRERQGAARTGR